MNRRCFIQLGRAGDVMNILPLVKQYRDDSGQVPLLMVAKEFSGIMDGVSYAEPLIWNGIFTDTMRATFEARRISSDLVMPQIYGQGILQRDMCWSFCRESWFQANATVPWGTLPLVFDRRNPDREEALVNWYWPRASGKKIVACCLRGISAPFPFARDFKAELSKLLGSDYFLFDISEIRAERIFDMLALLEKSYALITIDTGIKHLAHACAVPVISLNTREPSLWHGSPWRKGYAGFYHYDELPDRLNALAVDVQNCRTYRHPAILHVYADFRGGEDAENDRRMAVARQSWQMEYKNGNWIDCEFKARHCKRDSAQFGDPSPVPFHKDLIEHASDYMNDSDIVAWTNADICFAPGLTGLILEHIARNECAYTHRWDFFHKLENPFVSEGVIRTGKFYPGSDAFFFTVGWWRKHRDEIPDILIGREHNDEVLRQCIKLHGGKEIEACIYHEKHQSFWESEENFATNPGNIHNRKCAKEWFDRTWLAPNDWIWWSGTVDRRARS